MTEIDSRLEQLISLWKDASPDSLANVPSLCDELLDLTAGEEGAGFDRNLLDRAHRLSVKGQQRIAACVEIQSRTGAYSTHGELEVSSRVVTAGWEG